MRNEVLSVAEAAKLIEAGSVLLVAGVQSALAALPLGKWIGGSTPYFMTARGGVRDNTHLFCTIVDAATDCRVEMVPPGELANLTVGRFPTGFSYVLVPAFSEAHQRYAIEAPDLPDLYNQPLVGWVTGVGLDEVGRVAPSVVDGTSGQAHENAIAVMHVALPADRFAEADIVNLFTQGGGDELVFPETGFTATTCLVNGTAQNFAAYLRGIEADTSLPLVSSYAGAMINVSIQAEHEDRVEFYAPVVAGRVYKLAAPVGAYSGAYTRFVAGLEANAALSFNCILNYLYASLEGKTTGGFVGPVTFGEIAYLLLNQTLVRLDVKSTERFGQAAA